MQTRWASLGWSECELAGVKVVVLAWIAVDAFERHVILEELVPPGWEMHAAAQRVVAFP